MIELDHIGVAVKNLQDARLAWDAGLGLHLGGIEEVPSQGVKVGFYAVGGPRLELLEPLQPDNSIGKFLERRGEGMHHVAFRVDDIEAVLSQAKRAGLRLIDEVPRPGAGDSQVAFIHPASMHGVLVELVMEPRNGRPQTHG